ncbi:DUF2254 domain-containing protein [Avibacterium volantium]|uniref:Predicted membrane protein (DUF2254) n=1 Tax=Avibacterium volantium TaxID=762 RepID=A0A447SSN4_AVIVO|nr:DUF2254 domain-containing protein [Avibacterium volantium]VEB24957.1 Predicted membrane protein (DUF2254) [Avibacterium volantium]
MLSYLKEHFFTLILWLKKPSNGLWLTPILGALFAVFLALFSAFIKNKALPIDIIPDINETLLNDILSIMASSMLAVSTFSLSIMVSAFSSASNGATPRATELVMGDNTTRLAISSFISAFVYAVIAKITLGMGYYNEAGRFVLFVGTICVLIYLITTLITWVSALSQLGLLNNTLEKIETASQQALNNYWQQPNMGAKSLDKIRFTYAIHAHKTGYLSHINMQNLQDFADKNECEIDIAIQPGKLVYTDMPLAYVNKSIEEMAQLQENFIIENNRSYAQDPKFGLIVLSEVAQRALSQAVNDPGTAIKVISVLLRLLLDSKAEKQTVKYDRLAMLNLNEQELVLQPFTPICRDGSAMLEIHIKVQKALAVLRTQSDNQAIREAAFKQAKIDLDYALNGLSLESEKTQIQALHQDLFH